MKQLLTLLLILCGYLPLALAELPPCAVFDLHPPMDIPFYLSGNFGELRTNHFHTGIDIKTQGRTGIPIHAVEDGFVSRINVSPYGYGYALYLDHPNGITSVYGHMERYAPRIDSVAKAIQYSQESFRIDTLLQADRIPIKRGELIGYSGNSGSSGGPHLHFELRETVSEDPINPLPSYKSRFKDSRPPICSLLALYPLTGRVVGKESTQEFTPKALSGNRYRIDTPISAWGDVGSGIRTYDYMDGTSNTYTPHTIELWVDGTLTSKLRFDRCNFDQGRYINSVIDYALFKKRRTFVTRTFAEPGNHLSVLYDSLLNRGAIAVDQERIYACEYRLTDIYGNRTSVEFRLQGVKQPAPAPEKEGLLSYQLSHRIAKNGVVLRIPAGVLYTDLDFHYKRTAKGGYHSPIHTLGSSQVPLHKGVELAVEVENDTVTRKEQYCLLRLEGGRKYPLLGEYKEGWYYATTTSLGDYLLTTDTTPPTITPIGSSAWGKRGCITLKIGDNLSGIESFRGEIDGAFALFCYDPKRATVTCLLDKGRMKQGRQHQLTFLVVDGCGNQTHYTTSFH